MEFSKQQITEFTKQLCKLDGKLQDCIIEVEELIHSEIAQEIQNGDNQELIEMVKEKFFKYCRFDSSANLEMNGAYFQDYDSLFGKLDI